MRLLSAQTPAFILSLLRDAEAHLPSFVDPDEFDDEKQPDEQPESQDPYIEAYESKPRGGFTDVGRHTGGDPRDTAWPLVRAALGAIYDALPACCSSSGWPTGPCAAPEGRRAGGRGAAADRGLQFRIAMATLEASLLQFQLDTLVEDVNLATAPAVDDAMQMLEAVARAVGGLVRDGAEGTLLPSFCEQARLALDAISQHRARTAADRHRLPEALDLAATRSELRDLAGAVPGAVTPRAQATDLEAARAASAANLEWLPLLQVWARGRACMVADR